MVVRAHAGEKGRGGGWAKRGHACRGAGGNGLGGARSALLAGDVTTRRCLLPICLRPRLPSLLLMNMSRPTLAFKEPLVLSEADKIKGVVVAL